MSGCAVWHCCILCASISVRIMLGLPTVLHRVRPRVVSGLGCVGG